MILFAALTIAPSSVTVNNVLAVTSAPIVNVPSSTVTYAWSIVLPVVLSVVPIKLTVPVVPLPAALLIALAKVPAILGEDVVSGERLKIPSFVIPFVPSPLILVPVVFKIPLALIVTAVSLSISDLTPAVLVSVNVESPVLAPPTVNELLVLPSEVIIAKFVSPLSTVN